LYGVERLHAMSRFPLKRSLFRRQLPFCVPHF